MRIEQNGNVKVTIVATADGDLVEAFMQTERVSIEEGEVVGRAFDEAEVMINPTLVPETLREVVGDVRSLASLRAANAELEARVAWLEAVMNAESGHTPV